MQECLLMMTACRTSSLATTTTPFYSLQTSTSPLRGTGYFAWLCTPELLSSFTFSFFISPFISSCIPCFLPSLFLLPPHNSSQAPLYQRISTFLHRPLSLFSSSHLSLQHTSFLISSHFTSSHVFPTCLPITEVWRTV